jgi:hypothetical protein
MLKQIRSSLLTLRIIRQNAVKLICTELRSSNNDLETIEAADQKLNGMEDDYFKIAEMHKAHLRELASHGIEQSFQDYPERPRPFHRPTLFAQAITQYDNQASVALSNDHLSILKVKKALGLVKIAQ